MGLFCCRRRRTKPPSVLGSGFQLPSGKSGHSSLAKASVLRVPVVGPCRRILVAEGRKASVLVAAAVIAVDDNNESVPVIRGAGSVCNPIASSVLAVQLPPLVVVAEWFEDLSSSGRINSSSSRSECPYNKATSQHAELQPPTTLWRNAKKSQQVPNTATERHKTAAAGQGTNKEQRGTPLCLCQSVALQIPAAFPAPGEYDPAESSRYGSEHKNVNRRTGTTIKWAQ